MVRQNRTCLGTNPRFNGSRSYVTSMHCSGWHLMCLRLSKNESSRSANRLLRIDKSFLSIKTVRRLCRSVVNWNGWDVQFEMISSYALHIACLDAFITPRMNGHGHWGSRRNSRRIGTRDQCFMFSIVVSYASLLWCVENSWSASVSAPIHCTDDHVEGISWSMRASSRRLTRQLCCVINTCLFFRASTSIP